MKHLYLTLLYNPFLNILVFFYNTIAGHNLGFAIIFLTILIRILLFPIFQKVTRYQLVMQELQPKLKLIQEQHKDDLQKQSLATMALFQEHKVNPFMSFFLTFVQFPILIALYQIFQHIFDDNAFSGLYSFVATPSELNTSFLGLLNLENRSILLVSLAAVLQYLQIKLSLPKKDPKQPATAASSMMANMAFIGPIIIMVVFINLPAALSVYLITTTLFSIAQQAFINRQLNHEKLERLHNGTGGKDGV